MSSIWNLFKHKYLGVAATVAMLLLLPVAIFVAQQPQDPRGVAEDATTFSFSPLSSPTAPITSNAGEDFNISLMLEPKNENVTSVKLTIIYDHTNIRPSVVSPIQFNSEYFPEVISEPVYTDGKIQLELGIGSDTTKVITTRTKVLELNFTALNPSEGSKISIGTDTIVSGLASDGSATENVLFNSIPAYVFIE